MFSNFIWSMTRLQDFRMVKFSQVENPRWPQFLQTTAPMVLKFHMEHDQTAMLQKDKIQPGRESKMFAIATKTFTFTVTLVLSLFN